MRFIITFLVLLTCPSSFANSCVLKKEASLETLSCPTIEATLNSYPTGIVAMNLSFTDQFQLTFEVLINNESQTTLAFNFNDKRTTPTLTQQESLEISKLSETIKNNNYFSHPELIQFFKHLPANIDLSSLREASRNTSMRKSVSQDYIILCNFVGLYRKGFYNIDNDPTRYSKKVTVGEHESNCYGRCGSGCDDGSPSYTQQCLNHDVCHRATGENLGVCSDEFWLAAPGYVWAPLCNLTL